MIEAVKKFQEHGIFVTSGCIVGFDSDDLSIFQKQFDFFSTAGIPQVTAYPLQAVDRTPLKERMQKEGRYIDLEKACLIKEEFSNHLNTFTIIPKQMTIKQLQQGLFWLLWKFNDPTNTVNRLKIFFDNFENSSDKDRLEISKINFGKIDIGVIWRFLKYYITEASVEERKALWQMIGHARKSSLPYRFDVVIGTFFSMKNTQEMLINENPQIGEINYPLQGDEVKGEHSESVYKIVPV